MTPSADLRRSIRTALCAQLFRRLNSADQAAPDAPVVADPSHDPDWAVREIVDDVMFKTAR